MKRTILSIAALAACALSYAQPKLSKNNIDEVLGAMTLQEKATLLVGGGWGSMLAGSLTASSDVLVSGAAGTTRDIPRLGIPKTVVADGPAGLRINPTRPGTDKTFYCTGFPVGTVLASTWNTDLVKEVTSAMGNEVKEYGVDVLLAPGQNLHRNPLCGRNFEYFSEDPLLSGKMAAAYVNGIQSNGVGVSAKHFAANSQETNRMNGDSRVNPRALRELYLKGFEIMVKESDPWTIMSSYNRLNGPYTQEDKDLLTTILRDEWGFRGIVMTDWTGKRNTAAQVAAGNDLMEPGEESQIKEIVDSVNNGTLSVKDLDTCVRRMLEYIVRTPRFAGYKYSDRPDLKAHAEVARKAAGEGLVLLKNDGATLPMKDVKNVALYGVSAYDFIAGGTGSGNVNKEHVTNIVDGLKLYGINADASLADWYMKYIAYAKANEKNNPSTPALGIMLGDPVISEMAIGRSFIERLQPSTDMAILTIARNAGEGDDRKAIDGDFTLTGAEREMLQTLCDVYHAAGKKVVVVLNIGGVIETASWKQLPDAILLAWTPGQEGGAAIADVLTGKVNPSGKLPMTFPVSYLDHPSSFNFPYNYTGGNSMNPLADFLGQGQRRLTKDVDYTNYEEGIWVGYRYFDTVGKEVSYPFGYGLSYTTFAYSNPQVKVAKDGTVTATVTVKNTGSVAGKEVVQLYVKAPEAGLVKPEKELRAFAKTRSLAPGESQIITMTVDPYTLASFNEATSAWETAAGEYTASFAASVEDVKVKAGFKILKPFSWKANAACLPQETVKEIAVK
ncbi:MAG: glycoside hydrolase family 3 C-terminal domain-containing protein [Bacteroidales bacterium]|nr:glycoside hydrolase family 3 C-terminal domain-containing protein [Bacteroidales bacterium]